MRRYEEVVSHIRKRIEAGTLKLADRLPSVRELSALTGFSMVTIHHAYALLESDGIIVAQPRTGFFVKRLPASLGSFPDALSAEGASKSVPISSDDLNFQLSTSWHREELAAFGAVYPSDDLFSRRRVNQTLRQVLLHDPRGLVKADVPEGDPMLREVVAKRAAQRGIIVRPQDVLITGSGSRGLDICIAAMTKPGDVVLVETPTFFPLLAALRRRHLMALEIYSHPVTGIDPDQLSYLLHQNDVAACLLMPVNHYPTGVTYTKETMQKVARLACEMKVPIIENDLFGNLSYANELAASLKSFDENGYVIQFSSMPGISPSGYGIGWIISDRFHQRLLEQTYFTNPFGGEGVLQRAAAEYATHGNYGRQLRRVQDTLQARMQRGLRLVSDYLPKGSAVSSPTGGFMCWVRGPHGFDATTASQRALSASVSLVPGPMLSPTLSFRNFMALNFSFEWTPERIEKLRLITTMLEGR